MDWLLLKIDPVLIQPYRWLDSPILSWWLGTFFVALWSAVVGEITMAIVNRVNRSAVKESMDEMNMYRDRSMNALKSGNKKAYKQINKLANEAYGKTFFLTLAMGMASIWPVFLAAAWFQERFGGIRFPFPYLEDGLNFVPFLLICYIIARILVGKIKKALGQVITGYRHAKQQLPGDSMNHNP
ncbi:MAG TPA: hypothetical protein ENN79_03980 [Desulfobacteraceae bacterium]|nr:hypothetical protein [Desulfobacteraceae bacterium]